MLRKWEDLPKMMQTEAVRPYYEYLNKRRGSLLLKRMFDIVVSTVLLILVSPILVILSVMIVADSKGGVFYRQERVTQYGRVFRIFKFRTMVANADKIGTQVTVQNDNRITKVGEKLRKYRLDELPQLFNILMGDMSLVGPRPERPFFVEKFKEEIPRYMIKHQVRPGLTGWAQVNGYRGDTSIIKRIEHDLYYIENWTLGFDFKIMFLTVFKGFINKNAY